MRFMVPLNSISPRVLYKSSPSATSASAQALSNKSFVAAASAFFCASRLRHSPNSERGLPMFFFRSARNTRSASAYFLALSKAAPSRSRSGSSQSGGSL